jgi:hypothetical protein
VTEAAEWERIRDVRRSFRSVDDVRVASGRTGVMFNIDGKHVPG